MNSPPPTPLAIFNDTPRDQTASIKLPARFRKATDLHSGALYHMVRGGAERPIVLGAVQVAVPYQDAMVLRLE